VSSAGTAKSTKPGTGIIELYVPSGNFPEVLAIIHSPSKRIVCRFYVPFVQEAQKTTNDTNKNFFWYIKKTITFAVFFLRRQEHGKNIKNIEQAHHCADIVMFFIHDACQWDSCTCHAWKYNQPHLVTPSRIICRYFYRCGCVSCGKQLADIEILYFR
jgi:hypothetical protein